MVYGFVWKVVFYVVLCVLSDINFVLVCILVLFYFKWFCCNFFLRFFKEVFSFIFIRVEICLWGFLEFLKFEFLWSVVDKF